VLKIDLSADIAKLTAGLQAKFQKQVPFAAQQAINSLGEIVRDAERDNLHASLEKHVPFTMESVALKKARSKKNATAVVYIKDIGAAYIGPYITGGKNKLYGAARDMPVNIGLNSYGNIPRGKIKSLLSQPNVFAGPVTRKKTGETISGVWERIPVQASPGTVKRRTRGRGSKFVSTQRTKLKLLVKFTDAHDTDAKIAWEPVAEKTIRRHFNEAFDRAMRNAINTAK
jgi:hypothetical protein